MIPHFPTNAFRHLVRTGKIAAVTVLLASCVSVSSDTPYDGDRSVLTSSMEDLDVYYIRQLDFGDVTNEGLLGLQKIDPDLAFAQVDDKILIRKGSSPARSVNIPDNNDPAEWGRTAAAAIDVARAESEKLRASDADAVQQAFFAGFLHDLDMFSRYSTPKQARQNRAFREGFGGVGIRIMLVDGLVKIVAITHYTPAERAGLRIDDVITAIDGVSTTGMDQTEIIDHIRGEVNSDVTLSVMRGDDKPFDVTLTRSLIVPETVMYRREGDVAYIRIFSFNTETTDSLKKAVTQAQNEIGDQLKGYVIDLRGNPGGLLDQAVSVSDLFLESGEVVSTHGRHRLSNQHFEAGEGDAVNGLPIAVLMDGNSASASEIVGAALQDGGRAVVIGSNSYGKGTVQTVIPLPNRGELTITWAKFYAPSGYMLHHLGVLPSICTVGGSTDADQILSALKRNKGLKYLPVAERKGISDENSPVLKKLRASCPPQQEERALELHVALKLIGDKGLYSRILEASREKGGVMVAVAQP